MADKVVKTRDTGVEKKLGMSLDDIIATGTKPRVPQQSFGPIRRNQNQNQNQNQRQQPYRQMGGSFQNSRPSPMGASNMPRGRTDGVFEKKAYTVLVSNLPPMDQKELENCLKATFGVCGKVSSIKLKGNHAYVGFEESSSCSRALTELKGSKIKGNFITIDKGIPVPVTQRQQENHQMNVQQPRAIRQVAMINGRQNPTLTIHRNLPSTQSPAHRTVLPGSPYGVYTPEQAPIRAYMLPQTGQYIDASSIAYRYPTASSLTGISSSSILPQSKMPASALSTYQTNGAATLTGKGQATVVVSNVPEELTAQEVQGAFSCVGTVTRTEILLNSSGVHTGRVAVTFQDKQSALEAVKRFDGGDLNSNTIRVFLE